MKIYKSEIKKLIKEVLNEDQYSAKNLKTTPENWVGLISFNDDPNGENELKRLVDKLKRKAIPVKVKSLKIYVQEKNEDVARNAIYRP